MKFVLSALQSEARMRDYSQAFFWLSDAKIINCCYNSTEPSIGLKLNEERTTLNSLKKCITKYSSHLSTPYVLHNKDVKTEDGIMYLPLYMIPLL